MDRWTIACQTCERNWPLAGTFSFYEQQSLESHPCPHCGAYTLACAETHSVKLHKMHILRRGLAASPVARQKLLAG